MVDLAKSSMTGKDQTDFINIARDFAHSEKNFNNFAAKFGVVCDDATLPKNDELRGVLPLQDPGVTGAAAINTKTTQQLADIKSGKVCCYAVSGYVLTSRSLDQRARVSLSNSQPWALRASQQATPQELLLTPAAAAAAADLVLVLVEDLPVAAIAEDLAAIKIPALRTKQQQLAIKDLAAMEVVPLSRTIPAMTMAVMATTITQALTRTKHLTTTKDLAAVKEVLMVVKILATRAMQQFLTVKEPVAVMILSRKIPATIRVVMATTNPPVVKEAIMVKVMRAKAVVKTMPLIHALRAFF